jgi:hypothetical protein
MFDLKKGGTTQKKFTTVFIDGLFPATLRQAVRDRGPETFRSAIQAIKEEFVTFTNYNQVIALQSKKLPISTEGKIADVALNQNKTNANVAVPSTSTKTTLCDNCNLPRHKTTKECTLMCRLCPGLAPHKFYKRDYCRQYLNMKAKHQQNGTWVESKTRAYNANIVSPSTLPDPSEMSKLTTAMETFTTMFKSNVSKNTRILIDSGCNSNIIASPLHSDTPIIHRESKDGISTANGQIIPILGKGTVLNIPADFVPSFVDSLLSVSQMTELKNSCFIFFKDVAYEISLTSSIINLLTQIHTLAVNENLILCTAPLTTDKLYAVDTNNKNTIPSFAASTYYQTAKFDNVHDLVKYFHETWSHASLDLMVHIIKSNIFTNLPTSLTETAIRKYFPPVLLVQLEI